VSEWEAAIRQAAEAGIRVVNVRTGIVQSARGGTLRIFRPLFTAGLGGAVGSDGQRLSWIDLDDVVDVYNRAIFDPSLAGPINAVAPKPVSNREYASTLARVLKRPAFMPVPSLGPRLLLGDEGSRELVEADQNVDPSKLRAAGHTFRYTDLEDSLRHQLGRYKR
jgi:uncharacterized protein